MLGDGEIIQAQARQHPMALIRFALQPILVFIAAVVLMGIGTWFQPSSDGGLFNDIFRWIDTLLGLLTLGLFLLALVWFPIQVIRWKKRRYLVTNRRVLYIEGWLRRNSRDAGLKMITDIGFRQTFIGGKMGFGDLTIATAANRPLHFREMRDAIAFKKVIMAAQQGTLEARADEILGNSTAVPSVAAVATAIDPASFPPPTPAWDGSDVPQMAEDDLPPSDPEIFGSVAVAAPVVAAPVVAATAAAVPEPGPEAPAIVAEAAVPDAAVEAPEAVEAVAQVAEEAAPVADAAVEAPAVTPEASTAMLADIDSVLAAPEPEPATGAAAVTEALARLADLRDSGAITEADYDAKKQELLGRL